MHYQSAHEKVLSIRQQLTDLQSDMGPRAHGSCFAIGISVGHPETTAAGERISRSGSVGRDSGAYGVSVRLFSGPEAFTLRAVELLDELLPADALDVLINVKYSALGSPLKIGDYCRHCQGSLVGTVGGFARSGPGGPRVLVGNSHVLANCDSCARGDIIYSGFGGYGAKLRIGALLDWIPLSAQQLDAAVCRLNDDIPAQNLLFDPSGASIGPEHEDVLDVYEVFKVGAGSGRTYGKVTSALLGPTRVEYASRNGTVQAEFGDMIEFAAINPAEHFATEGDSGAWIIDQESFRAYALVVAGGTGIAVRQGHQVLRRTVGHLLHSVFQAFTPRLVL